MKRFIKICLIVVISCLVISLGCLVGGVALGGTWSDLAHAFQRGDFTFGFGSAEKMSEDLEYEETDYDDYDDDFDDMDHADDDFADMKSADSNGKSDIYKDIQKIDVEMRSGYLDFVPHDLDEIRVEVESDKGKTSQVRQEKKELKISNNFRAYNGGVTVYYPENMEFQEIDISMNGGMVNMEGPISARELETELKAGIFEGGQIHAIKSSWEVGTGEMILDELYGDSIEMEAGTGTLTAAVHGKQSDYNYELECGIGTILLGDGEYSGVGIDEKINNGQNKKMEISCGIGSVEVQFTD